VHQFEPAPQPAPDPGAFWIGRSWPARALNVYIAACFLCGSVALPAWLAKLGFEQWDRWRAPRERPPAVFYEGEPSDFERPRWRELDDAPALRT
jgi:hypothetical protein